MDAEPFIDRRDGGRRLAALLTGLTEERPVVIALPRGGVPVAVEVARVLGAPLDLLGVRKLGAPGQPELAVGAVAEGTVGVIDQAMVRAVGMSQARLRRTARRESRELARRIALYRGSRAPIDLTGRTVIVVDDGLATGMTDLAAVRGVRARGAGRVIVAAPVGSDGAIERLSAEADDVVCVLVPELFGSVGAWYEDFAPVGDSEVLALLRGVASAPATRSVPRKPPP